MKNYPSLRLQLFLFGHGFEGRERGVPAGPGAYGQWNLSIEGPSPKPPKYVPIPSPPAGCEFATSASKIAKGPGVDASLGFADMGASSVIQYNRPQRPGRLSFPLDKFETGKSFVLAKTWTKSSPGGFTATSSLTITFTRRR